VLARWDGPRRYANLRKLARLARSYEALRGPAVEGFVRFVREQDALGAKELEAVAEEEQGDAVRLLTIHGAKGLEFKVVVVADAGRDTGSTGDADEIVALTDGRFGFKVVHPTKGGRTPVFDYEQVRQVSLDQGRAERLRLYYVAMTRAIDRLIVSGAVSGDGDTERETPMSWVLKRLELDPAGVEQADEPVELERGDARFIVRLHRRQAEPAAAPQPAETASGQLALFTELPPFVPPPAVALHELAPVTVPAVLPAPRLSFSALSLHERCSLRFWAERVAGMRPAASPAATGGDGGGLLATELGDAVHRLLELVDLDRPAAPDDDVVVETVRGWYPQAADRDLETVRRHVHAYCGSELAKRIAALGGARPERPFAFEQDGVLLRGRLDVLWRQNGRALVLDYKTNLLEERRPHDIVADEYGLQRAVYAAVCLLAGAEEVEVVYQFLERPDDVVSETYGTDRLVELRGMVGAAIGRALSGEYAPSPSAYACQGCPLLDLTCPGPRLLAEEMPL
jgi:ATP-dependent exoDNAse (exonuclease V) beta subunit